MLRKSMSDISPSPLLLELVEALALPEETVGFLDRTPGEPREAAGVVDPERFGAAADVGGSVPRKSRRDMVPSEP